MTRRRDRTAAEWARVAALPALTLALLGPGEAALGQVPGSVQDYRLPPPAPSPTPSAAGPVDSEHPIAAPTRPVPEPSPTPSAVITLPPGPPAPGAPRLPRPQPAPAASPAPAPAPAAPEPTVPSSTAPESTIPESPVPSIQPAPTEPATLEPVPPATRGEGDSPWPWIAGSAAMAALLGGLLLWRRRKPGLEREPAEAAPAEALPQPSPPATLKRPPPPRRDPVPAEPLPAPPPVEPAAAPESAESRTLDIRLEARHLSRAMVNATLAYRLILTNRADRALGPLRIAGDIISAHASLSSQDQLAPPGEGLATIHQVPALAPGETLTLSGELRLPLASILPIHSGGGRVFVPLARFRAEAEAGNGPAETHVFVVGQASEQPGGALRPFPLDRGPGVDRGLGQRELGLPA